MATAEIAAKNWRQFCEKVAETHRGTLICIQLIQSNGNTTSLATDLPLQKFFLDDQSDACNDTLFVEVGLANEKPLQYRIVEPIRVLLKNGGSGDRFHQLHILAENGTTELTFHPGITSGLLKELSQIEIWHFPV